MVSLLRRMRKAGVAVAIAAGLTILAAVASPLVSDELANVLPVVTDVSADESAGGGG